MVEKPASIDIDDLLKLIALEERIYRMRCVEAWSMVIPWVGFPLAELIKRVEPTRQREVRRVRDAARPEADAGPAASRVLDWPYVEGLRIDEAMHPLTLLAVGLYGETLPNQNGAPLRLVVPWKYGFKGIKSIVKIRFVEKQPPTTWNEQAPQRVRLLRQREPEVDHPRWSQATERRIGEGGCSPSGDRRCRSTATPTQVASLYAGMDLRRSSTDGRRRRRQQVNAADRSRVPRWLVYAVGLVPAVVDLHARRHRTSSAPIRSRRSSTTLGIWALRFLIATLCVTPLRQLAGVNLLRYRRALGLLAFYYAALPPHDLPGPRPGSRLGRDLAPTSSSAPTSPSAWRASSLLVPLAVTSNNASIRRLGGKAWARLHKLVYLAAVGGALHFLLVVKSWPLEPLVYAAIVAALLLYRLLRSLRQDRGRGTPVTARRPAAEPATARSR